MDYKVVVPRIGVKIISGNKHTTANDIITKLGFISGRVTLATIIDGEIQLYQPKDTIITIGQLSLIIPDNYVYYYCSECMNLIPRATVKHGPPPVM